MAVPDAARRSGSLLLRALAVGGFATVAWLLSGGVAAADEQDHSDVVTNPLDAVNLAVDPQHTATAALLAALTERAPVELPDHAALTAHTAPIVLPVHTAPIDLPVHTAPIDLLAYTAPALGGPDEDDGGDDGEDPDVPVYQDEDDRQYSHTGGSHSAVAPRSISNTMPAEQYEAKVAAKAAARQAALAPTPPADEPPAPPVEVPQDPEPAQPTYRQPVTEPTATTPTWENPQPFTPTPAPQQAPAPTAPTSASAGGLDGSGGHRGGVIASVTGQDRFAPPTVWRVEQRDDRRAPGSIPGLPSTSPD
ncbi:hypothetical protein GCM10010492_27480 [Saccharothrix mutabilis subsp. mutabilis]|uniref:Secreted protein n=1 Tax=Saccharothrix mutabilis subsp. mutabilis TaxID=66855 RepID=A0ABN0TR24_9PSEU